MINFLKMFHHRKLLWCFNLFMIAQYSTTKKEMMQDLASKFIEPQYVPPHLTVPKSPPPRTPLSTGDLPAAARSTGAVGGRRGGARGSTRRPEAPIPGPACAPDTFGTDG